MEILSFIKIQNDLTREEFNNRFKIEFIGTKPNGEASYGLSDGAVVVSCPHINCCGINGNCKKCWENAMLKAEFKYKDLLLGNIKNCKTIKELDILTMDVVNDKDNFEANQKAFIKRKNELNREI
ncbi:hypothetical protein LGK95_22070 [Clostridium algoriphilum]|uniref:hypothetical protein n=1 Tax=Clostridium algoriphilum TaxID=198347 RepID=UPI001CF1F174|nr:hypothetical protein [Clostridium algoriphilum]MCB2296136.1 hypothetical protein [Clostridium algoriphilum]